MLSTRPDLIKSPNMSANLQRCWKILITHVLPAGIAPPREHTRTIWKAHLNLLPPLKKSTQLPLPPLTPVGYDILEIAAWIFSEGISDTCSTLRALGWGKTLKNCSNKWKQIEIYYGVVMERVFLWLYAWRSLQFFSVLVLYYFLGLGVR